MNLQTPVLFLVFNRPDTTQKVFEQIKKARPTHLFLAADGPRRFNKNEKCLCEITRRLILENIDWDCKLETLLRNENLGCGRAVSEAITWFFTQVEEGIILEDDTLPDLSFFNFCTQLLDRYRYNKNVMIIAGTNLLDEYKKTQKSYIFSDYAGIWGWASWRRAWNGMDLKISTWDQPEIKASLMKRFSKSRYNYLKHIFDLISKENNLNTWDYQWWYHRLINNGVGIVPTVNNVKNIGFQDNATHTFSIDKNIENLNNKAVKFPLIHPENFTIDKAYDRLLSSRYYSSKKKRWGWFKYLLKKQFYK
jgi:hypothetical protein